MISYYCCLGLLYVTIVVGTSDSKLLISRRDLVPTRDNYIDDVFQKLNLGKERKARALGDGPDYFRTRLNDYHQYARIVYSGLINSEVIIVLTYDLDDDRLVESSDVYRSTDYGDTFVKITSRIGHGSTLADYIYVSPANHKKIIFIAANLAQLYVSMNEGVSFATRTLQPNTINQLSIAIHPTEDDWLLAHDQNKNELYISKDLGVTPLKKIADNVTANYKFQWCDPSYDSDKSMVYFVSNGVLYTQQHPYEISNKKTFHSSAFGELNSYVLIDRYIFIVYTIHSEVTIWVSADRNPVQQAKIPLSYNHERYIVDSIRSLQALVIIKHSNDQYHLYLSEEQGIYYYQSLANLVVEPRTIQLVLGPTIVDLEVVESMNYTTYIANQIVEYSQKRTLISFDAGANWHKLTPPNENSTNCEKPLCSLHLHMSTSEYWRTRIYSKESAPGIIIAHGAIGEQLSSSEADLYISNDGGLTWSMALDNTWGVSVLDHGSLIIAVPDHNNDKDNSRTLMYTCDEGFSWSSLTFTPFDVSTFGVVTEPGETTTVISLYGVERYKGWVINVVDFTEVFTSFCGPDDYYKWTPVDMFADNGCFLGASITVERRKGNVCCFNGHTYNRVISYSTCSCTIEDYECDYGYKHANGYSGHCVRDEEIHLEACIDGKDYYLQSQGYRKIGGNVCSGGVENSFQPLNVTCCNDALQDYNNSVSDLDSSNNEKGEIYFISSLILAILLLILIIVLIIISLIICFCLRRSRSSSKSTNNKLTYSTDELCTINDAKIYETPFEVPEASRGNTGCQIKGMSSGTTAHCSYPDSLHEKNEKGMLHPMEAEIIQNMYY